MQNALLRREMVVTLPVKVAVAEPQALRVGDRWSVSATVSSVAEVPVSGTLSLYASSSQKKRSAAIAAAHLPTLSDGVKVSVPVLPAVQTLTEAHSAVLLPGMDKEALLAQIRSQFVNVSSMGAAYREISILDRIREALPDKVEPRSENVLDLLEALYVRKTLAALVPGPVSLRRGAFRYWSGEGRGESKAVR